MHGGRRGRFSPPSAARDGDYALNDLASLRARPFHASRNLEGFTHRDIIAPTVRSPARGTRVDFSAVTAS